jgi:hypothetical protein
MTERMSQVGPQRHLHKSKPVRRTTTCQDPRKRQHLSRSRSKERLLPRASNSSIINSSNVSSNHNRSGHSSSNLYRSWHLVSRVCLRGLRIQQCQDHKHRNHKLDRDKTRTLSLEQDKTRMLMAEQDKTLMPNLEPGRILTPSSDRSNHSILYRVVHQAADPPPHPRPQSLDLRPQVSPKTMKSLLYRVS